MSWNRITPPTRDELRALIVSGMSHVRLMRHYGVSKGVISSWKRAYGLRGLQEFGGKRKSLDLGVLRTLVAQGKSQEQIAAHFRCSVDLVARHLAENNLLTKRQAQLQNKPEQQTWNLARSKPSDRAMQAANPFGLRA